MPLEVKALGYIGMFSSKNGLYVGLMETNVTPMCLRDWDLIFPISLHSKLTKDQLDNIA